MNTSGCADPHGCDDADQHLYEYQHGELTPDLYRRVEEHLATCAHCRELYEEEQIIHKRVKQCACETAPEQLRARVFAFISTFRSTGGPA